ncbi:MAG: Nif11-like leader peptide family RiPP precursor [Deltaproteobacteria bacterium]|nr:Nif11-like leader peptide family RiPP precursor [Deltaproteobacteria bacterium]
MSIENAKLFLKKLIEDEAFKKEFQGASDTEREAIAEKMGFTREELLSLSPAKKDGELTDEDLDKASGGWSWDDTLEVVESGLEVAIT